MANVLAIALALFLIFSNLSPFGATYTFTSPHGGLSEIGPSTRVAYQGAIATIKQDAVYFRSRAPYQFDTARLAVKIRNPYPDQQVTIGYQDQDVWHYKTSPVLSPALSALNWGRVGNGPYLYQKNATFSTVRDFLDNIPGNKNVGVYDFDPTALEQTKSDLPGYVPSSQATEITTPLRGKITMYVYLKNEPFSMRLQKRDLNWYTDPGVSKISVSKGNSIVYQATIDDDGDLKGDSNLGKVQTVNMSNPGPGLPEAGVYKITIDQPTDSVITSIQTNLHKIVFQGPFFPVGNRDVYSGLVKSTTPTSVYTNASQLSATAYHQVPQAITANGKPTIVTQAQKPIEFDAPDSWTALIIPKSDMMLNGNGYFSFTQAQFFTPTPFHIFPIENSSDLSKVDFVLTNYVPPTDLGNGWYEVRCVFDLSSSFSQKDSLTWLINSPGLAENTRTIEIKDIQMTLTKRGWF